MFDKLQMSGADINTGIIIGIFNKDNINLL